MSTVIVSSALSNDNADKLAWTCQAVCSNSWETRYFWI